MKKTITFFSFILLISAVAAAQTDVPKAPAEKYLKTFSYGIKAGGDLHYLTYSDFGVMSGFSGGVFARVMVHRWIGIQPEVLYSYQGGYYERYAIWGSTILYNEKKTLRMNYLNIPVPIKFYFNKGFNIATGPVFGIPLGANGKFIDYLHETTDEISYDPKFNFSWSFGIGYDFRCGAMVEARYNVSCSDVFEDDINHCNPGINLSFGWAF